MPPRRVPLDRILRYDPSNLSEAYHKAFAAVPGSGQKMPDSPVAAAFVERRLSGPEVPAASTNNWTAPNFRNYSGKVSLFGNQPTLARITTPEARLKEVYGPELYYELLARLTAAPAVDGKILKAQGDEHIRRQLSEPFVDAITQDYPFHPSGTALGMWYRGIGTQLARKTIDEGGGPYVHGHELSHQLLETGDKLQPRGDVLPRSLLEKLIAGKQDPAVSMLDRKFLGTMILGNLSPEMRADLAMAKRRHYQTTGEYPTGGRVLEMLMDEGISPYEAAVNPWLPDGLKMDLTEKVEYGPQKGVTDSNGTRRRGGLRAIIQRMEPEDWKQIPGVLDKLLDSRKKPEAVYG